MCICMYIFIYIHTYPLVKLTHHLDPRQWDLRQTTPLRDLRGHDGAVGAPVVTGCCWSVFFSWFYGDDNGVMMG